MPEEGTKRAPRRQTGAGFLLLITIPWTALAGAALEDRVADRVCTNGRFLPPINTPDLKRWMAAMETEELIEADDGVATRRAKARSLLGEITQRVKQALKEAGIGIEVFLLIPMSGDAVATLGTLADPPPEVWERVEGIVSSIVQQMVGLDRVRCRQVPCATTTDQPDRLTIPTPKPSLIAEFEGTEGFDREAASIRLPPGYPVLAQIHIDPANWFQFERLFEDTAVTRILGRGDLRNGRMVVHVACASESVREKLEDGWE
jgi:hypothetical protein